MRTKCAELSLKGKKRRRPLVGGCGEAKLVASGCSDNDHPHNHAVHIIPHSALLICGLHVC